MTYRIRSVYIGAPGHPSVAHALALDLGSALKLAKVKALSAQSVQVFAAGDLRGEMPIFNGLAAGGKLMYNKL